MTEKLYTLDQARRELARRACSDEKPYHEFAVDLDGPDGMRYGNPTAVRCTLCETVWPITEDGSIDLRNINDALVEFGISYPLGARGVNDLIGAAEHDHETRKQVEALLDEYDAKGQDVGFARAFLDRIRAVIDE